MPLRISTELVDHYNWDSVGNPIAQRTVIESDEPTTHAGEIDNANNDPSGVAFEDSAEEKDNSQSLQAITEGDRLLSFADTDYRYDDCGNQISELGVGIKTQRRFNAFNQLTSFSKDGILTQYDYDPLGRRIAKHTEQGQIDFIWDGDQLLGECLNGQYTWYINRPSEFHPVALIKQDSIYYYHLDQLNTPRFVTNQTAEVVWENTANAYGYEDSGLAEQQNSKQQAEFYQPIRFQGQYYDQESGFHYNRYRYYSPKQQRFINQDPIGLVGGINHYQYAPNPVNWVDPFGLLCKEGEKRLKRTLDTLVGNGFEKEVIDAIFKAAIACTPIDNQDVSTIKYASKEGRYRKEHIYDITGLDEENNLITLNKVNKSGEMTPVTISIDEFANQHKVNGEKVKINPDSKPTKYHKRTVGEVDEARKAFPVQRKEYIKKYASDALNDDNHESHNHFTPKQLNRMKVTGQVPKKYNVHHKKPIFRCDPNENPNDLDNLELLTEDFHSRENKKLHWYEEGDEPYDENGFGPNLGSEVV